MKAILLTFLTSLFLSQFMLAQNRETPLQAGDQIGISIAGIPPEEMVSIKNTYRIDGRGYISLLYLDQVKAAGLTASELARSIEGLYKSKEIYTRPSVNVSVDTNDPGGRVVFVNGEVVKVGQVPFRPGLTAAMALATAGGGTPYARLSKVKLIRGGQVIVILDLSKAEKPDGQTLLQPDDYLVIPD
ncbi:MAG: polysaccharide biosynthesis/export family protein [Verrucomicrobiaceae bacterium]|nr:polysaccharide biosynthesis/export family protein [Verrucomicrobiaceae bacterium]